MTESQQWAIWIGILITCVITNGYIVMSTTTAVQVPICNGCKTLETKYQVRGDLLFIGIVLSVWILVGLYMWFSREKYHAV